ncbi:MAG: ferrous iron transport protein B [Clostridia bacterium]|nr:ferrous iron transport protein B [Clostridia bacterium]
MRKVLIIGNPNVGKSTLFNSLTKSSEHTGNFHGVTVDSKSKRILLDGENLEVIDLPGMYSLNSFSDEERVARDVLLSTHSDKLVLVDANCLRKNMYLILQMIELGIDFKILINNYDYFIKHGNKLNFEKLQQKLNIDIEIINAKKIKINKKLLIYEKISKKYPKYLEKYIIKIKNKFNLDEKLIINALNGIFDKLNAEQINYIKEFNTEIIQDRYHYIDELLDDVVIMRQDFIYGYSKMDKFLLNPLLMTIGFSLLFLLSIYLIFFLVGGWLSDGLSYIYERIIVNPFMDLIVITTDNVWLIEFFQNGVFSSIGSVLGFLPQVCLLFIFLTILEDSGIISRMAYVFDDFLSIFGLNGKALYIMLMGLGCNSMSTMASRNMGDDNLRIKSAILNPYISCMARLPVYIVIASAFFGVKSYIVVAGLYLLGFVVALIMSLVLTHTILPKQDTGILLEFPPLRNIDIRHALSK